MKNIAKGIAVLGVLALFLPTLTMAAGTIKVYEGSGRMTGNGLGMVEFKGKGTLKVTGSGNLTVSKNAKVTINGKGTKSVSGNTVSYSGFDGSATVKGKNVSGSLSGTVKTCSISGKGKVTTEGDGKVTARGWSVKKTTPKTTTQTK
jgi:hypothetical protein